jgi:hypothetical protein
MSDRQGESDNKQFGRGVADLGAIVKGAWSWFLAGGRSEVPGHIASGTNFIVSLYFISK